jgi:sarcosine oxidase
MAARIGAQTTPPDSPRVAVVGAGIVGLATAYAITEAGEPVTVFESGVPGNGQSGGESRIFRHGHDDPRLAALAAESRAIWAEWGRKLGVELVSRDGVVALGENALRRLRVLDGIEGVSAEAIDPGRIRERLPLLAGYSGAAAFDAGGGAIRTRAAVEAFTRELDGSLRFDEVISLAPTARGTVEIRAGGDRSEYSRVVVCAGRGTARLARGLGLTVPVRLGAHVRVTFAVRGDPPDQLACLQDGSGAFGEPGVYAAPTPGNATYGVGLAEAIDAQEDGTLTDPEGLASMTARTTAYVRRALPGLDSEPVDFRHCWSTWLPWGDDGIGVWEREGALFVAGNNLFKHAPALGRALARTALGDELPSRLRPEAELGRAAAAEAVGG